MIDFLKNNKFIAGIIFLIVILLLVSVLIFVSVFNPSGKTGTEDPTFTDTSGERVLTDEELLFGSTSDRFISTESAGTPAPDFRALSKIPAKAHTTYLRVSDGSNREYVRFTAYTNGNAYDVPLDVVGTEERVSNETIQRIGNAGWALSGESTFTQYLDAAGERVQTYLRSFVESTSTPAAAQGTSTAVVPKGRHLDENIVSASLFPKGDKIFYIVKTSSGGSEGYIEEVLTAKRTKVWSSILHNLTISNVAGNYVLIYTNPSSEAEGLVWILNTTTAKITPLITSKKGLSAQLSTDGTKVLYSYQEEGTGVFSLHSITLSTGESVSYDLNTMSEKCTWGRGINSKHVYCAVPRERQPKRFLEDWYMGISSSDDQIWRLDTDLGLYKLLIDPKEVTGEPFDAVELMTDSLEQFLVFRTKNTSTLWSLKLPQTVQLAPNATSTVES